MMPLIAFAQTFFSVRQALKDVAHSATILIMLIAVAVFLWGIIKFIAAGGDETKIKSAKGYIIYGLIGIFIMVSLWGIIEIIGYTFRVELGGTITAPTIGPPSL